MSFAVRSSTAVSDINITPLVDVMLVLLVIFMLSVPVIERQLPLDLPQIRPDTPPPPAVDPLRLQISAEGQWLLEGRALSAQALDAVLKLEGARSPQPELQIAAADEAAYERVTAVLASARGAGLTRIGFVSD